jgi:transcriptional regulator with XRE-family HTH domain
MRKRPTSKQLGFRVVVGLRIKELREKKWPTQAAFAKFHNIPVERVSRIERGANIQLDTIYEWAELLGEPPSELLKPPMNRQKKPGRPRKKSTSNKQAQPKKKVQPKKKRN